MDSAPPDPHRIVQHTFVAAVEYHPTIGSTNDRAKECAVRESSELPLLIVAGRQTAGRGRGANRWWSGPGTLACSVLLDAESLGLDRGFSPLVSLVAAAAVAESVRPLLPGHCAGIHWPNDVFVGQRKLAGILIEGLTYRRHVIGIGLNTNCTLDDAPEELRGTATTLRELTGRTHDHTEILIAILQRLEEGLRLLVCRPEQVGARANELCVQHGRTLAVEFGGRKTTGCCAGIATDGALLLDTPDGQKRFYTGVLSTEASSARTARS